MDLKKIWIIISREFNVRVRKKSFIITTILTPILFAALMILPSVFMLMDTEGDNLRKVMVCDGSGILDGKLNDTDTYEFEIVGRENVEYFKNNMDSLGFFAVLSVSPMDSLGNVRAVSYSQKQLTMDAKSSLVNLISNVFREEKLGKYSVEDIDALIEDAAYEVPLTTIVLEEGGNEVRSIYELNMAIAYIAAFMIYMFVTMFGSMVMRGIIEEKSSRIVEIIVSSVRPMELMVGKIVGIASVALMQFLVWGVFLLLLFGGLNLFLGWNDMQAVVSAGAGMQDMGGLSDMQRSMIESGMVADVTSVFAGLNIGTVVFAFVAYFVLGYLLYSSMFAAVGSAVDNEADSQQFVLPVTIPLIAGLMMMIVAIKNPDGALAVWGSMIPFTSPMVMMARVPFGVPVWELALSLGILLLTFIGISYISAKIYRVGILDFGKKNTWKDLWRWIRY